MLSWVSLWVPASDVPSVLRLLVLLLLLLLLQLQPGLLAEVAALVLLQIGRLRNRVSVVRAAVACCC